MSCLNLNTYKQGCICLLENKETNKRTNKQRKHLFSWKESGDFKRSKYLTYNVWDFLVFKGAFKERIT